MPIHLHPTAPIAADAILTGDPGRAMAIAQSLFEKPRMANHHRGLWGYTGTLAGGRELTVQATGMGGPSAAIVLEELAGLGVERAIRVGSAGALTGDLNLADTLVVRSALPADGTSAALGAKGECVPDEDLTAALSAAAPEARVSTIVSTDLFYDSDQTKLETWREQGACAVEMETATLFELGRRLSVAVACTLVVSDIVGDERVRISDEELETAGVAAAAAAARALAA